MLHSLRLRTGVCVAVALAALLSLSVARQPARLIPQIRTVSVIDSHCGAERREHGHVETLACVAKGAHLQFYDRQRDAVYEIRYASGPLRIEVQNDYAGLEIVAEGLWDENEHRVLLQKIWPSHDPATAEVLDDE